MNMKIIKPKFCSPRFGFTLIELMIVAMILSTVGITLYSTFSNGLNIWKRINQEMVIEDVNIFFDKISRELRGSFQFSEIPLRGRTGELNFPAIVQVRDHRGDLKEGIGEVYYSFEPKSGAIYRQQKSYSEIYVDKNTGKQAMIDHVSSLEFQYYHYDLEQEEYSWVESWQDEDESLGIKAKKILPVAVRITIGIIGQERNERRITKTVWIPSGCCNEGTADSPETGSST